MPAAYLAGFTRARVFDVAAHNKTPLASNGYVPYDDIGETGAATENVGRVGYYVELKRKDDGVHQYHGLTRWLWVSMDAFGDRLIDTLGVPIIRVESDYNEEDVEQLRIRVEAFIELIKYGR